MTSTATTRLQLDKMGRADDYNSWDTTINLNFDMIDEAIAGVVSITISGGNYTLSNNNYASDEALNQVIVIASADAARSVIIPSLEKTYKVHNKSAYVTLFKTASGTGTVVLGNQCIEFYCDGTECYRISNSGWGLASTTAVSGASAAISTLVTGEEFNDAMFVFSGVSCTGAANLTTTFTGCSGSSAFGSAFTGGADVLRGALHIPNCRAAAGVATFGLSNIADGNMQNATFQTVISWGLAAGITTVTFAPSAGTFDAGNIVLYMK